MRLLADEQFPFPSVKLLRNEGHDISSIALVAPAVDDESVIAISILEDRVILTFDSDFGKLIFKRGYKPPAGVIYLRLGKDYSPELPGIVLIELLTRPNFHPAFQLTTFNGQLMRQRSYTPER